MPRKRAWTEELDAALRRRREAGADWETIGLALGMTANAVQERARRLKIRMARAEPAAEVLDLGRPPLPPGHVVAWEVLVAGTLLEGVAFERLGPMGRERAPVIGE